MDRWLLGFILGVLSSPWLDPSWPLWLLPVITLVLCPVVMGWRRRARNLKIGRMGCVLSHPLWPLLLIGVLCGMQWSLINAIGSLSWKIPESERRQTLPLRIRITSIVDDSYAHLRFDAQVAPLPESAIVQPIKLRLQWYGHQGEKPKLGELWQVDARLRPVAGLQNQTGFNYQAYLRRHGIQATGYVRSGHRAQAGHWHEHPVAYLRQSIYAQLAEFRPWLANADILLALSIGQRHWLNNQRWQVLQRTGVAHLMAISGLHLSLVFAGGLWFWKACLSNLRSISCYIGIAWRPFNSMPFALAFAWLGAAGYAALADFSVATVRALLLISLFLLLRFIGVHSSPLRILRWAVAGIFVLDPMAFLDNGFWLSCIAVVAIFSWLWRSSHSGPTSVVTLRRFGQQAWQLWRFEVMLTFALLPLTIAYFTGFAWIAPLTNLLVVPLFTVFVIPFLLVAVVLVFFAPGLAFAIFASADSVITAVWYGLNIVSSPGFIDLAAVPLGWLVLAACLIVYAPLSTWMRCQWLMSILCSVVLLTVVQPWLQSVDPRVWVHVLDVGQGTAAIVEHRGEALLVDTGPGYQGAHQGASIIQPFLRRRGVEPKLLVLSHGHADHIGAADYLRAAYPQMVVVDTQGFGLPCEWGRPFAWQGLHLTLLAPMPGAPAAGENNNSCVLQLRFATQSVLFPGDVERLGEFRLVRYYQDRLRSDLMLVPHHGSRSSSHNYLLARVQPDWAIISSGYLNRFNMPHPESLARLNASGAEVVNTATAGQVSLVWYRNQWHMRTQRADFAPFWYNQID